MIKAPELLEPKREVKIEEVSPEVEAINIEREIIKRSSLKPEEWIEKYAKEYRDLFDVNKEKFMEMHKKTPEALYQLLSQILGISN